jgi:enoyl-CoA hydratase/carnithine racemase
MPPVPQRIALPATGEHLIVSNPATHVLLLILNRPKALNAMTPELQEDIERILDWAEAEPEVWFVRVSQLFLARNDNVPG